MDRALVTLCQDLPESLGLYNTEKNQLALSAIRAIPLLEHVGADSRKLALIRDWMRSYEPAVDEPLSSEICMDVPKETDRREREEREKERVESEMAAGRVENDEDQKKKKQKKKKKREQTREREQKKRPRRDKETDTKEKKTEKNTKQAVAEKADRTRQTGAKPRVRAARSDLEDVLLMDESSSSSDDESSSSSSSDASDSDARAPRRTKVSSNLPPIEVVLSSDEDDDEPNDMFDTEDPDVYEVEKILRKKTAETYGEQDLYEVKWEGYEETTWEPASNISKDLIDEFEGQPRGEVCPLELPSSLRYTFDCIWRNTDDADVFFCEVLVSGAMTFLG
uniref:Chromo domain-containing protein n=1 Tax=Hyaloperonospora arabidopsidis (strain Emoy2) TaxID=559515 RepID=M4BTF3_HYAAE